MRSRYRGGLLEGNARARAREMRSHPTSAEGLIWSRLRRRNVAGAKFRRQYPLLGFIADFCCVEHKLVIELDGDSHGDREAYDAWRTEKLAARGFRVLRFSNEEVRQNLDGVLEVIWGAVKAPPPSPSPMSNNGGGERESGAPRR
jgi:very-short-patch-repair endonuclease